MLFFLTFKFQRILNKTVIEQNCVLSTKSA